MTQVHRYLRTRAAVTATAVAIALGVTAAPQSTAASPPSEGILCTANDANTFDLVADDGYIATPDGNSIYTWSYRSSVKSFQFPGPALCVTSGQRVTVVLHNRLPEPVSIIFPGQSAVTADGAPAQPQFDNGTPAMLTSLVQAAEPANGSVTYSFVAGSPGTYLYTSGSDVDVQRQMGLYGALVVRPAGAPAQINDRIDSQFNPGHEYLFLLSEIDPDVHLAVERGEAVDWAAYTARYFMINGRSMPDTLAPNNASWLPGQPYGAFVHIRPYDADTNPLPAAIRYLNAGRVNYPFHPHGSDERVVNKDGHALAGPGGQDTSYNKFDLDVYPGQSLDVVMDWRDVEHWDAATNPVPTEIPAITDQLLVGPDTWFSESPYLGVKNALPPTITDNNECGEYYHIAHSHALQQATNFGASFGGMMTVFRIDPPNGCPTN